MVPMAARAFVMCGILFASCAFALPVEDTPETPIEETPIDENPSEDNSVQETDAETTKNVQQVSDPVLSIMEVQSQAQSTEEQTGGLQSEHNAEQHAAEKQNALWGRRRRRRRRAIPHRSCHSPGCRVKASRAKLTHPMVNHHGWVGVPNKAGNHGTGSAEFTVKVTRTSDVFLEFHVLTPGKHEDEFYIHFDRGRKLSWGTGRHYSPTWVVYNHKFRLHRGTHKLYVSNRDDGAKFNEVAIRSGHAFFETVAKVVKIEISYIPICEHSARTHSKCRLKVQRYTGMKANRLTSRTVREYTAQARVSARASWGFGGARGSVSSSFKSKATTDFDSTSRTTQSYEMRTIDSSCETRPPNAGCYVYQAKTTITMSDGSIIEQAAGSTRNEHRPLERTYLSQSY